MPTCLISRSSCRDSERSFVCHARTFSSGVGPYRKRLMECMGGNPKESAAREIWLLESNSRFGNRSTWQEWSILLFTVEISTFWLTYTQRKFSLNRFQILPRWYDIMHPVFAYSTPILLRWRLVTNNTRPRAYVAAAKMVLLNWGVVTHKNGAGHSQIFLSSAPIFLLLFANFP